MFGFAANNDEYDLKLSRLIIGNFVLAFECVKLKDWLFLKLIKA